MEENRERGTLRATLDWSYQFLYAPIESGCIRLQAEALLNSTRFHAQTWNLARCLRVTGVLEQKIRMAVEAPMPPVSQQRLTPLIDQVRIRLDPALFETAWLAGQHLPLEQIPGARKQWFTQQLAAFILVAPVHLTQREREVLQLLGDGYSNQEIAEKMVIAPVTVKSYLHTIYKKIGVSSRTEALRVALDLHLLQR